MIKKLRKVVYMFILLIAISNLYGCTGNAEYILSITEHVWETEDSTENVEDIIEDYDIKKSNVIDLSKDYEKIKIKIKKVKADSVTIKVHGLVDESGSMDDYKAGKKYVVKDGESLYLKTPTICGGSTYKLELKKVDD